jgi:hypothetical protein
MLLAVNYLWTLVLGGPFLHRDYTVKSSPALFKHCEDKQERQRTCNITLRCIHRTTGAMESNKHYIFLCVCVCVWGGGMGARVWVCACLLIQCAAYRCHTVCVLSHSTVFFDITWWPAQFNVCFDFLYNLYVKHFSVQEEFGEISS